ncbi:MAG: hypothetical protein RLZZ435_15 [Cyanobacteriota bacterium]
MSELPIIQHTYDLIKVYVPTIERLPKTHKYTLGDRIINELYDLLKALVTAQFSKQKLAILEPLNPSLSLLRYQTRLLLEFNLISIKQYESLIRALENIGSELGGWIKYQK